MTFVSLIGSLLIFVGLILSQKKTQEADDAQVEHA